MDMRERLEKSAQESRTILCFGVDPDIVRVSGIATGTTVEGAITPFFHDIIDRLLAENAISALKPNYAFFAQYGFDGLFVLEELIQRYKGKVPIILDAKRGDIGKTSEAYAREAYDFWGADAITLSPYMGHDSVSPFLREGKLAYLLCRTSNKGAADFQELRLLGKGAPKRGVTLYEHVAKKALEWKTGLVAGATSDAIKKIAKLTKNEVPLLIPGIGAQGGDLGMVLKAVKGNIPIHRINVSSSLAYAFEKHGGKPADAALKEAENLNREIRGYF
ncbi:MAG: orotidine-5'-phosphate decarboxylase [Candidatus Micrarchaeota archaeon]